MIHLRTSLPLLLALLGAACSSTVTEVANSSSLCLLPNGVTCLPGATCPHPDGCNTCTCGPNQALACTERACAVDAGTAADAPVSTVDAAQDVTPATDASRTCERSADCPSGERCVFSPTTGCGESDFGVCRAVPGCESLPVAPLFCGCDGRTFNMPNACPPDRPFIAEGPCPSRGAVMLWQAPGGFAGTGPAVRVEDSGAVSIWNSTVELTLDGPSPAPDRRLTLSSSVAEALFTRWSRVDRRGLPHAPNVSSDCYPSVTVRRCATCAAETLRYQGPAQLTPEMNEVWGWFGENVPDAQPGRYCAF